MTNKIFKIPESRTARVSTLKINTAWSAGGLKGSSTMMPQDIEEFYVFLKIAVENYYEIQRSPIKRFFALFSSNDRSYLQVNLPQANLIFRTLNSPNLFTGLVEDLVKLRIDLIALSVQSIEMHRLTGGEQYDRSNSDSNNKKLKASYPNAVLWNVLFCGLAVLSALISWQFWQMSQMTIWLVILSISMVCSGVFAFNIATSPIDIFMHFIKKKNKELYLGSGGGWAEETAFKPTDMQLQHLKQMITGKVTLKDSLKNIDLL